MTQKYRRENEKNSKQKEDKKAVKDKEVKQMEVKLALSTLKPIHAKWLVDFYNHMITLEEEQVISSGWSASGIINSLKNGETCLKPLDPFAYQARHLLNKMTIIYSILRKGFFQHLWSEDERDSCDSEWEIEDGNLFEVIALEL